MNNGENKSILRKWMSSNGYSIDEAQNLYHLIDLGYSISKIGQSLEIFKRDDLWIPSREILLCKRWLDAHYTIDQNNAAENLEDSCNFPLLLYRLSQGMKTV